MLYNQQQIQTRAASSSAPTPTPSLPASAQTDTFNNAAEDDSSAAEPMPCV